ncbi:hypothetical protein GCM10023350_23090 [Nocardioides endophyticus]|uniref:Dihydrodiol dehydrogenase n=1 Tax=Nocardioides endophyticus TaxID=1353775 RepID=A0ABP8YTQ4_9ACTN
MTEKEDELVTHVDQDLPGAMVLTSEFASVRVSADTEANGPRLRIENRQNGMVIHLDPLELASLTWLRHMDLGPFLDPSRTGWSSEVQDHHEGDEPWR